VPTPVCAPGNVLTASPHAFSCTSPQQVIPGSKDPRTLGIQVTRITLRNASAGTNVFNANTGTWLAPPP